LIFRGGTALHNLYFPTPLRYSEDLDFVQNNAEPSGPIADAIRELLTPWLGRAKTIAHKDSFKMVFRFNPESNPDLSLRIKIEWNTREHFSVMGTKEVKYEVQTKWFSGECNIKTYDINELAGTKLRALYQRKKGRDLFDIAQLAEKNLIDPNHVIEVFQAYIKSQHLIITKREFKQNLVGKLQDLTFIHDMDALSNTRINYDPVEAGKKVMIMIDLLE